MPLDNNIVYCGSSGTTNLYGTVGTSSTTLTGNASLNNVMGTQAANLVTTGLSQLQPSAFSSIKTF